MVTTGDRPLTGELKANAQASLALNVFDLAAFGKA